MDPTILMLFQTLIPFLSTAVVAAVKKVTPKVPKVLLPALAPLAGVGIAVASGALSATNGALAGAAGVALREVYDQAKKALAPDAQVS